MFGISSLWGSFPSGRGGGGGGVGSLFSGNKNHETKLALVLISEMQNCMIRTALKQQKE